MSSHTDDRNRIRRRVAGLAPLAWPPEARHDRPFPRHAASGTEPRRRSPRSAAAPPARRPRRVRARAVRLPHRDPARPPPGRLQPPRRAGRAEVVHDRAERSGHSLRPDSGGRRPLPTGSGFPSDTLRGVKMDRWQTEFLARHLSSAKDDEGKKRGFRDVRSKLRDRRCIAMREEWVWPIHPSE